MCCWVASCCCVTDLRLATIIIAAISLVGNVVILSFTSWCIKQINLAVEYYHKFGPLEGEDPKFVTLGADVVVAILTLYLVISIVGALLDVGLFFGALTRNRDMLQCWSRGNAVVYGVYLVYFWVAIVGAFAAGYSFAGFLNLMGTVLATVVVMYFWIVVRSYDLKLQRTNESTVCGSSGTSTNYSYVPASSRPRDADKALRGTLGSPPPYSVTA